MYVLGEGSYLNGILGDLDGIDDMADCPMHLGDDLLLLGKHLQL
jgi:hypothetical protein